MKTARAVLTRFGAVALLIGGLGLWMRARLDDPLAAVTPVRRSTETRLTAFRYAPYDTDRSGGQTEASWYTLLGSVTKDLQKERTPENLHRAGLAALGSGRPASALPLLQEAVKQRPDDMAMLSDLAAAELATGRIMDAAEHSAMAAERDRALAPAEFTRALTLERLANRPAALRAWKRYLELDADSEWSAEARRHVNALEAPRSVWKEDRKLLVAGADAATVRRLVAKYPQHARLRIVNILLPLWGDSNDPRVFELMRTMSAERASADPFLLDGIEHAGKNRQAVLPAIQMWARALEALAAGTHDVASARYAEADAMFQKAGSPFALLAGIWAASTQGRGDVALTLLGPVEARIATLHGKYPSMEAEAAWVRALVFARRGDVYRAIEIFGRARDAARRAGEIEHEVAIGQLYATTVELVGDPAEAERERLAVVRTGENIDADADRMFAAYGDFAFSALRAGRPWLAREFAHSQWLVAQQANEPAWLAESEAQRALALLEVNRLAGAEASIDAARSHAMRIATETQRDHALASIDYTVGRIAQLRGRADAAVAAFSSAIAAWDRYDWHLHTATGLLARAEAKLEAGDRRTAENDLRAGIQEMEQRRADVAEPAMRAAYFERADRLFERLIELLTDEGRGLEALAIAERKRARVLLDRLASNGGGVAAIVPLEGDAIATGVGRRVAVLEIAVLERRTEVWLIHGGRVVHARVPVLRTAIEGAVARHLLAIDQGDEAALIREGRWLYDQLIAPVAASISPGTDLLIVPDGVLQAFPFGTLVTSDGTYLVQRYVSATAPSATVFLRAPAGALGDSLFVTSQPGPEGFDYLTGATVEAAAIARRHPNGRLLAGERVTPAGFLEEAARAAWVHFAGHATAGDGRAVQPALLFETAEGPPARLAVPTIAESRLESHPLIVLAACSTGRGKLRRNEGVESLAAAFLQAGARGVVATLWDVDDALSAKLFRSFHQHLREGARPADALRSAQLALLNSADPRDRSPRVWGSAFVEGTF